MGATPIPLSSPPKTALNCLLAIVTSSGKDRMAQGGWPYLLEKWKASNLDLTVTDKRDFVELKESVSVLKTELESLKTAHTHTLCYVLPLRLRGLSVPCQMALVRHPPHRTYHQISELRHICWA